MVAIIKLRGIRRKPVNVHDLDKPQKLSSNPLAIDAVYFNGSSNKREILACGTARRANGLVNGFLFLRIPEFSEHALVTPKIPDTCLYQTEEEQREQRFYIVQGIRLMPISPMAEWRIEYSGQMRLYTDDPSGELFDVKLNATWKSALPYFNYDCDISPWSVATGVAMETWSRDFFKMLEKLHQTHYEQYGKVSGTVDINGKTFKISTDSVRDHSFGEMRDWKNHHRYTMHFISLQNGDHVTVGVIAIPLNFSSITVGFVTKAKTGQNVAISSCNFELYKNGENGNPPSDYAFQFWAGEEKYTVEVKGFFRPEFYIGTEAEARFVEEFATFNVNGVKGWGAVEWQYRNLYALK